MDFRLSFFGWTFSLIQKIKFVIENKQMSSEFFLYTLSVEEGAMQHLPICLYIFYQSRESIAELINKYDCCIFLQYIDIKLLQLAPYWNKIFKIVERVAWPLSRLYSQWKLSFILLYKPYLLYATTARVLPVVNVLPL